MSSSESSLSPDRLADQVELVSLPLGKRVTRSSIELVLGKLQPDLRPEDLERAVETAVSRLQERAALVGGTYALEPSGRGFRPHSVEPVRQVTEFLALLSAYQGTRTRAGGHKPDLHFERLTALALRNYVGGVALVYSALKPGRGMRVKLQELGRLLEVESYPHRTRPERYDNGLDVVGWRKFPWKSPIFPVVLVQCTVGASDPIVKARETSERDWSDLLDIPAAAMITGFAIPHVLPLEWRRWRDLRNATELVLDRPRLLHLLTADDCVALANEEFQACLVHMRAQVPTDLRPAPVLTGPMLA